VKGSPVTPQFYLVEKVFDESIMARITCISRRKTNVEIYNVKYNFNVLETILDMCFPSC
jgi:hypothetical protein